MTATRRRTSQEITVAHTVVAEIVGNVGEVQVAEGQHVGPLDVVVVMESMKMEIPVLADVAGTVTSIQVTSGDVVQEGDVIAVIEPDETARKRR